MFFRIVQFVKSRKDNKLFKSKIYSYILANAMVLAFILNTPRSVGPMIKRLRFYDILRSV
jgi:hypothetical protein